MIRIWGEEWIGNIFDVLHFIAAKCFDNVFTDACIAIDIKQRYAKVNIQNSPFLRAQTYKIIRFNVFGASPNLLRLKTRVLHVRQNYVPLRL